MLASNIPTTWRHTADGVWHEPRPSIRSKSGFEWKIYYEKPCTKCNTLFVDPRKLAKYCTQTCANNAIKKFGEEQNRYKGYKCHTKQGYILVRVSAKPYRYTPEHRYLIEQMLGRELNANEVVHHINHDKKDNRIANLQLLTRKEHIKVHPACNQPGIKRRS